MNSSLADVHGGTACDDTPPHGGPGSVRSGVGDDQLSERELQVVNCLAKGMPNKRIATTLKISETTVKFHLRNISAKVGARNRTEAVFICKLRGFLTD